jgi:hypothetical protein
MEEVKEIFDSKLHDITKISELTGALSGLLTGDARGVSAAGTSSSTALNNNFLVAAAPLLWVAAEAALAELGTTGVVVASAAAGGYALHKTTAGGDAAEVGDSAGQRPPNMAPEEAGREGAFKAAKKANDIPVTHQPDEVLPNRDRRGKIQPGREYIFNKGKPNEVRIRDDAGGHDFGPNDPQNRGPHFNDPQGNHYDY